MARIRADYVFGVTEAELSATDGVLTSQSLTRLPVVSGRDRAAVTIHDATVGAYEIIHVVAHAAGAPTATVARAQEGTTAQAWPAGSTWIHGATAADFAASSTSGAFRGAWVPPGQLDSVAATVDFTDPADLSLFTVTVSATGEAPLIVDLAESDDFATGRPTSLTRGIRLNNGNRRTTDFVRVALNLTALGDIGTVSRVKSWVAQESNTVKRINAAGDSGIYWTQTGRIDWTQIASPATISSAPWWEQRGVGTSTGSASNHRGWLAGIEVYAVDPALAYMADEYVVHAGRLWRSDVNNNVSTPGVAEWTAVPLGHDQAVSTGGRPTGVTAGAHVFDTSLGRPVWWNGSAWVDASGTTV